MSSGLSTGNLPAPLSERSTRAQLLAAVVVPALLGAAAGYALGWSATAYTILSFVAALGGLLAGFEHRGGWDGAERGLVAGLVFGSAILFVHALTGERATVELPQPSGVLVVVVAVISMVLGAIGGRWRQRLERGAQARQVAAMDTTQGAGARRAVDRVFKRLMPLLLGGYTISYVDRVNLSFAEDQLTTDLNLTASAFGLAFGIFFLGYVLVEVPSNLAMVRFGARRWLARIMITWGLIVAATALAQGITSLAILRLALGAAEAGFFPAAIFLIAVWLPEEDRGRAMAWLMSGVIIAGIFGGPISGGLLSLDGVGGLEGWQWLFIVEGLPASALGVYFLFALPERPTEAKWIDPADAAELEALVAREAAARAQKGGPTTVGQVLRDRRILLLGFVYFCINTAAAGFTAFGPAIFEEKIGELSDATVGLIAVPPAVASAIGLVALGRMADRSPDQRTTPTRALLISGAGLVLLALLPGWFAYAGAFVASYGLLGGIAAFWKLPTSILAGDRVAASGIAYIAAIGLTGGIFGPIIVGASDDATGSTATGLLVLAVLLAAGALALSRLRVAALWAESVTAAAADGEPERDPEPVPVGGPRR